MQAIDIVQLVATVAAFAAAGSKLLSSTLPFWSLLPPLAQRFLPGTVLVLGALPSALEGATTWTQFGIAVMGALAFAAPGRHTDLPKEHPSEVKRVTPIPPPPKPPSVPPLVAMLCLVLGLVSCASAPPPKPCSADDPQLTVKLADCKLRMLTECKDVEPEACAIRTECRAWVRDYCGAAQ
jgi:hypothetical protein